MATFNKVILIGNCTRDPDVRYMPNGKAVADLNLAINHKYTTESGEKREEVTFVKVSFFGRIAEVACEYLRKGSPAFVEGRLKLDTWDDKETGAKRSALNVVGETLQLLGNKSESSTPQEKRSESKPQKPASQTPDHDLTPEEDNIPF